MDCYRLNVYAPLKIHMLKLYPPCNGMRRWDLWEVTRIRWGSEGGALLNVISALIRVRREPDSSLYSLPCEDTRSHQSAFWKRVLTRIWPCWQLNIQFPAPKNVRYKFPLFINHSIYIYFIVVWTDWNSAFQK